MASQQAFHDGMLLSWLPVESQDNNPGRLSITGPISDQAKAISFRGRMA